MVNPSLAIGVIGAGSWGTALSLLLAGKGHRVDLWVYEKDLCDAYRIAIWFENRHIAGIIPRTKRLATCKLEGC